VLALVWQPMLRRWLRLLRCKLLLGLLTLVVPVFLQARPQVTDLVSNLVSKAQRMKLSQSRSWHRLNHYQNSLLFSTRSSIRGGFFLHAHGESDPEAELEVTLQKMFSSDLDTRKKTQCKYLARREFLARSLEIPEQELEVCDLSTDWLRRLGAQKLSLVFASSFMNSAGSSFGHTFLKLGNPQNEGALELTDYGINFSAKTSDTQGALYALKGLFGNFPGTFSMLPFHQMMRDYLNLEGRDIWEYRLNLTPAEVQRLLFALLELEGYYFDYYFLDDNCSFQLLKLLEIAKPELELLGSDEMFVIPLDTVKRLQRTPGLILRREPRASLQTVFRSRLQELPRSSLYKIKEFSEGQPSALSDWSTPELELAQYHLALRQLEQPQLESWRRAQDQVSRVRARRPEKSAFDKEEFEKGLRPPEDSPDSSAVGLGGFQKGSKSGAEISWRFAFHDLLEPDAGAATWSELEVLYFRFRRDGASERSYLEEGRLLSMLSTSPVHILDQPVSWGVRVGAFQNGEELGHLSPLLQGLVGNSLDLRGSDLRWCLFAKGSAQETPDLRIGGGVGVETFFLAQLGSKLRVQAGVEKLYFTDWEMQANRIRGLWAVNSQFELVADSRGLQWTPRGRAATWSDDKSLRLQYQFLY
jgi:hypothetical protein